MIKECHRANRIAQEMKKKISIILQHQINNVFVGMITVSDVKISRDLNYAKIFVTFLSYLDINNTDQVNIGIKDLQNHSKFIKHILSKTMRLRIIPKLIFLYDDSLQEGIRITNVVSQIIKNDQNNRVLF